MTTNHDDSVFSMLTLKFESQYGEIVIEMWADRAPKTCQYFAELAAANAFESASVFRIVTSSGLQTEDDCPINIIQIGPDQRFDYPRHPMVHEDTKLTGLSHQKWTVSAARFDLGELYGSFFICMQDQPELDFGGRRQPDGQGFAAFGRVIAGCAALEKIFAKAESSELLSNEIPITNVSIAAQGAPS